MLENFHANVLNTPRLTSNAKSAKSPKFAVFSSSARTTTHSISGRNTFIFILYKNIHSSTLRLNERFRYSIKDTKVAQSVWNLCACSKKVPHTTNAWTFCRRLVNNQSSKKALLPRQRSVGH